MSAKIFVDTNVLVYARDASDPERQARAWAWMADLWARRSGHLSVQVLQEYYVTTTRKLDPPRAQDEARADVVSLLAWHPIATDIVVMDRAWAVQDRYGFSWWDALIVAAASISQCEYLLTEDLQHGQQLDRVTVLDPFQVDPGDFFD